MTSSNALLRRGAHRDGRSATNRPVSVLAVSVLGMFVVTLDATIVNVALPSIRSAVGGGIAGQQWVVDGYTLMFAALLLSAGAMSDRIGAKRTFGAGLGIFIIASAACGAASTLAMLVAARFAQGVGAAAMMPSSMALIRHNYSESAERARALAMWSVGGAVAAAAGPFFGGLLSLASWRWIFLVNIPVGVVALALLMRSPRSPHQPAPFDWLGQTTGLLAMASLTYGAIEAGSAGLSAPSVVAALVAALVLGLAFAAAQTRVRHPMVPPALFRSRIVTTSVAVGFAFMVGFYGAPFLFSIYLQQARGLSSLETGLVFLPMALVGLILTPLAPRLVDLTGPKKPVMAGLLLMSSGLASLICTIGGSSIWVIATLLVLVGIVGPLVMPATTAVLMHSVPIHLAGTASGVFNTSRQIGGAVAIAVFGALLTSSAGFTTGMTVALSTAAAVGAIAAAAVGWGMRTGETDSSEGGDELCER
ncbi:MFS transporter [Mycolicibacterium moriokaense]|nr:MFS transporter [Mycolicibacterium moriokaense]